MSHTFLLEVASGDIKKTINSGITSAVKYAKSKGNEMVTPNQDITSADIALKKAAIQKGGDVAQSYAFNYAKPHIVAAASKLAGDRAPSTLGKAAVKAATTVGKYSGAIGLGTALGVEGGKALIQGAHDQGDIATVDYNNAKSKRNANFADLMTTDKKFQQSMKGNNDMQSLVKTYINTGKISEGHKARAKNNPEMQHAINKLTSNQSKHNNNDAEVNPFIRGRSALAKGIQDLAGVSGDTKSKKKSTPEGQEFRRKWRSY